MTDIQGITGTDLSQLGFLQYQLPFEPMFSASSSPLGDLTNFSGNALFALSPGFGQMNLWGSLLSNSLISPGMGNLFSLPQLSAASPDAVQMTTAPFPIEDGGSLPQLGEDGTPVPTTAASDDGNPIHTTALGEDGNWWNQTTALIDDGCWAWFNQFFSQFFKFFQSFLYGSEDGGGPPTTALIDDGFRTTAINENGQTNVRTA